MYQYLNTNSILHQLLSGILRKNVYKSSRTYSGTDMCQSEFYQYKYSEALQALINEQIQVEQQAAQDYLGLAAHFLHPAVARPGTGGFFMNMYEEEIGHALCFMHYHLTRGGVVKIGSLKGTNVCQLSLYDAFCNALGMEKHVTQKVENIISAAEKFKDYHCVDFLTSVFMKEQIKSINEMSQHVTKLCRIHDENGLYQYDLKLAKSHPYTFKSCVTS